MRIDINKLKVIFKIHCLISVGYKIYNKPEISREFELFYFIN